MPTHNLTKCEMEVMDVVWQLGRVTVKDVCDAMERPLAYTTVMTMLKILDEKRGVLRRGKLGRAYIYEPTVTREEVCKSMTSELKRHLFRGSVKSVVLNLIENESMSASDIEELRTAIDSLESDDDG